MLKLFLPGKEAIRKELRGWGGAIAIAVLFFWWLFISDAISPGPNNWSWIWLFLIIAAIARITIVPFIRVLRRQWLTVREEFSAPLVENAGVRRVILQLRLRANRLRMTATMTLLMILVCLATGLFIFSRAESSASRAQVIAPLSLQREISNLEDRLDKISTDMSAATDEAEKKKLAFQRSDAQDELNIATSELQGYTTKAPEARSDTAYITTVLSTKVGSALTLLFLVQILVTLYRYNIRVASFYDARADALQLSSVEKIPDLQAIAMLLTTEKLDFGKMPATPAQHLLEMAKELVAVRTRPTQ